MRTAYTESLRTVYIALAVIAFIATVASLFIEHYGIDQALETEQYLVDEKKERNAVSS